MKKLLVPIMILVAMFSVFSAFMVAPETQAATKLLKSSTSLNAQAKAAAAKKEAAEKEKKEQAAALKDFKDLCKKSGGIAKDQTSPEYHYCSINSSNAADSAGGATGKKALSSLQNRLASAPVASAYPDEATCKAAKGTMWDSTTNQCKFASFSQNQACGTFFNWGAATGNCPSITETVVIIFNWAAVGVAIVVVAMIIVGAIQYITGSKGGEDKKAKAGMGTIRNAIIALVLYMIMWSLLNFLVPGGVFTA